MHLQFPGGELVKKTEARAIGERFIQPHVPEELVWRDGALVMPPVVWIARGLSITGSVYGGPEFHVGADFQPLYIAGEGTPAASLARVTLTLRAQSELDPDDAHRLRHWLAVEGLPTLRRIDGPRAMAKRIKSFERGHRPDPQALEALAYSQYLTGDSTRAATSLRRSIQRWRELNSEDDAFVTEWDLASEERAATMLDLLDHDENAFFAQLEEWREERAEEFGAKDLLEYPVARP